MTEASNPKTAADPLLFRPTGLHPTGLRPTGLRWVAARHRIVVALHRRG